MDYTGSTGTVSIFYNPSGSEATKYQNPTDYFCPPCPGGGGVFVNHAAVATDGLYAGQHRQRSRCRTHEPERHLRAGPDINASSIANFAPIPNFTGLFDGQGQIIANLTIASTDQNVGLFGSIGSTGVVRNLNLTDVTVSGLNSQFVGTLAGTNAGTISNVSATDVAVSVGSNGIGGGLVGSNSGTITNAFATGDVTGGANSTVGGLVGANERHHRGYRPLRVRSPAPALTAPSAVWSEPTSGTITDSTASGAVTSSGANSTVGGLVGANEGTITDSTASGAVTSSGASSTVGGFVGANAGTITDSTASGAVTSSGANSTVGGFAGASTGTITNSTASGVVTSTGANSTVGDFVGAIAGTIT